MLAIPMECLEARTAHPELEALLKEHPPVLDRGLVR
jgi:hypothetical protein